MIRTKSPQGALKKSLLVAAAVCAVHAVQVVASAPAAVPEEAVTAQAQVVPGESAVLRTGADGNAYAKVTIATEGAYIIRSTASSGVEGDTCGYLYDESMGEELFASDDCHADTSFCISETLQAGTYYLCATGKEGQAGASITIAVEEGRALNALDYKADFDEDTHARSFELGDWEHGDESTQWQAADEGGYEIVGYADRYVFSHAQESGAVEQLAWKSGLPKEQGRFVLKTSATGSAFSGDAYYLLEDDVDTSSISELTQEVTLATCNAIDRVELGTVVTIPTNWSTRWTAITTSDYTTVGYCKRSEFEALGGDEKRVKWTKGLPNSEGSYVVKLEAADTDENPYTGTCYAWLQLSELGHAGSGEWIVSKRPTFTAAGSRHLKCAYCGAACDVTPIPALKNTAMTAGSGASLADYTFLSTKTVRYDACYSQQKTASVPNTVTIDSVSYKVVAIAPKAFANSKALTSIAIGDNVTGTLGPALFKPCAKLQTLKVGKGVTAIGPSALAGHKSLKTVTLGSGVKKIGKTAFKGCKKLQTLTINSKGLKKAGVKNCLKGSSVTTVKVPKAKKKAYAKLFVKGVCGKKVKVK